jgi:hypothetical protein
MNLGGREIPDIVVKIASVLGALTVIVGTTYTIDGRWVRCPVYAEGISQVQTRQLKFEERGIQKDINDLEDRLENPKLPEKRRGVYQQRLRQLKQDLLDVKEEKADAKTKGGK